MKNKEFQNENCEHKTILNQFTFLTNKSTQTLLAVIYLLT